jgi:hypothetical protein
VLGFANGPEPGGPIRHDLPTFTFTGKIEVDLRSIGKLRCLTSGSDAIEITSATYVSGPLGCKNVCNKLQELENRKFLKGIVDGAIKDELTESGLQNARPCEDRDNNCPEKTLIRGWDGTWEGEVFVPNTNLIKEGLRHLMNKSDKDRDPKKFCTCKVEISSFEIKGRINADEEGG